MNIDVPLL